MYRASGNLHFFKIFKMSRIFSTELTTEYRNSLSVVVFHEDLVDLQLQPVMQPEPKAGAEPPVPGAAPPVPAPEALSFFFS